MKNLLIIIPAYNEEKTISSLLAELTTPEMAKLCDVLVMNDASSDRTNMIARQYGASVVSHVYNLGYGGGLQLGYKYAVRKGYKYVIQMDADGQHDICNVLRIYDALTTPDADGNCPDIVLGSRFVKGGQSFAISGMKKFAIIYFRTLIRLLTGKVILDPTTGLQGLNRRSFLLYSQFNQFDDKYPDTNVIVRMLLLGYNLQEIPAVMHERATGESMHSGLKPVIYMFRMTLSVIATWLRGRVLKIDKGIDSYV